MKLFLLAIATTFVMAGYVHSNLPVNTPQVAVRDINAITEHVRPLEAFQIVADTLSLTK